MKNSLLVLIFTALFGVQGVDAQIGRQMSQLNSPDYEMAAQSLRSAPPRQYNFSKAVLSDVMRLMAEDAGIGFFGLPDGVDGSDSLVTFTINASPFVALETLAKANGISLIPDNGIWYLRPANDQELIGRIYEINYNSQELVTKNTQTGLSQGGGSGGGGAGGLNLQGSPDFFVVEPSRILEDIQNILDIPTTGGTATFAPTASVDTVSQLSLGSLQGQPNLVTYPSQTDSGAATEGPGGAKVIWNSDSNTLYVVASRQQHQWIEAYIASADRPQPMISVEVKFIETSRDPSSDFGIDWDGTLGSNGLEATLSDATGPINLDSIGGYSLPTAVLSYSDLNLKLRAIYQDSKSRAVSYPRMMTLDNREVSFRSVINQPVLGSSASASLGAGATQTSAIEYLPIGTVINVLPKRMAGDKILLNVSLTVSDIVGTEIINGNPFPIATSRVYTAPLTVKSGYTVAISGLDAARSNEYENGLPFLGRLPVIGYAFKNRKRERSRQHLMMLITPIALNTGTEGLTKKPITREPWKNVPTASSYSKAPVYDAPPVNSYPVQQAGSAYPEPIDDIPAFNDPVDERKANHTFGKAADQVAPANATISERAPAAASGESVVIADSSTKVPSVPAPPKPIASPLNTPMVVDSIPAPAELVEDVSVAVVEEPEKEVKVKTEEKKVEEPAPEKVAPPSAEVMKIRKGVDGLKKQLAKVPEGDSRLSPDDAQMVVNVYDEAQQLLDEVDTVRGDKSKPLQGDLGDAWWELINVKTQATKISRRSPESLALGNTNSDAESDE